MKDHTSNNPAINTAKAPEPAAVPNAISAPEDELTVRQVKLYLDGLEHLVRFSLTFYLRGLKRFKVLMISIGILLFGLSSTLVYNAPRQYEGTASFTYNSLQKKLYGEMTDKLSSLLEAGDYVHLGHLLSIPPEQAKEIRAIKATNIYHSLLSEDMAENDKLRIFYVYFLVTAQGKSVFNQLGTGLETYYNNNAAVKELVTRRQAEILPAIQYRYTELRMLDSLIRSYTASLSRPLSAAYPLAYAATPTPVPFDPQALFKKGEDLTAELADMHLYLKDHRVVKLQDDFLTGAPRDGFSLQKGALLFFLGFLILSCGVVLIGGRIKSSSYAS